ncbi:MAG: YIP1 family protein [Clostridia bacterium]|nr:YIP1 family protein [Clostridia bacterium]
MRNERRKRVLSLWMAAVLLLLCFPYTASADQATSYTYTVDEKGEWVRTQDAYLPDRTLTELGLSSASDLFIDGQDMLYIADTGNKRIIVYNTKTGNVDEIIKIKDFSSPSGVFVTGNGKLYVADPGAKAVFVFSADRSLEAKLTKPDSPLYSDTNYEPKKVAADEGGNIYIISEGVYNGVIQLAATGEFLGFFAVNKARLTLSQQIQRLLFTRAQVANLVDANPTVFTNVFVDRSGIVYTATSGTYLNGMKKHSTNGGNMFKTDRYSLDTLTDVYVDRNDFIYTCSNEGYMDVYTKDGELIFEFGSRVTTTDVVGLFTRLPSIAVDSKGGIWALDGNKGYLQSFRTTEYSQMVFNALNLYEAGKYDEAKTQWNEVLRLNQMSALAHDGAGKAYLHTEQYEEALEHFRVANDKDYYSEAFWEVRNTWIQKYMGYILLGLVVLLIGMRVMKTVDKRHGGKLKALKERLGARISRLPFLRDLALAKRMDRHPDDCGYEIGKNRAGSVLGASLIYLLFFIAFMLYQTQKGFIYQYQDVQDMDIGFVVLGFWVLLGGFIFCNYLVTSINDGNGTLKQIFMVPAYSILPTIAALLAVTLVSHVLTYNESFLLTLIMIAGIAWSVVALFVGLQTIHQYSFKETVMSLLLTIIFMLIIVIVCIILSMMWNSLSTFLTSVGKELMYNAF